MASGRLRELVHVAPLLAAASARRLRRWLYLLPLYRWRFAPSGVDRLLLAPQDIRTSDPTVANDIYGGRFSLAGRTVVVARGSPFLASAPSRGWQAALHGFDWLRHLRASNSALARSQARALVDDWIASAGRWHAPSWEPHVTARRIISWLSHSPLILDGADRDYYRRFVRSLVRQVRYLRKAAALAEPGRPRLAAVIALNYAGLCIAGAGRMQRQAAQRLDEELSRQVLPDGGHASRNPADIVDLLLDLLPLRQTFAASGVEPPHALLTAIDRMMPMVRFFRHGDGSFALFNGMGTSEADAIATVLAYDDSFGKPLANASYSGYQRAAGGGTTLVMDTGAPPPLPLSGRAHAGCLSFELASGRHRLVVNCGHPPFVGRAWRRAARATAAHSTAVLADTSSCRFLASARLAGLVGDLVVAGPAHVEVERSDGDGATLIRATHDGYRRNFGIVCERTVELAADGTQLAGRDRFRPVRRHADVPYAIRFHLHPDVRTGRSDSGLGVLLMLPNRETWAFQAENGEIAIEESIYLPDADGPRRSEQIVILGTVAALPEVGWTLRRVRGGEGGPAGHGQLAT